jgi:hypothetical protein
VLFSTITQANDGVFYASGNQLIPIVETDISVTKEVLTIRRVDNENLEVTVEYNFYNPTNAKRLTVGFEAFSPSGDVDGTPINGKHPFIRDFSVVLNNEALNYKTALVTDTNYVKNGNVISKPLGVCRTFKIQDLKKPKCSTKNLVIIIFDC